MADATPKAGTASSGGAVRPRILIVEDSMFIVLALESVCEALGWDMVGPARSITEGLELAQGDGFDAALLDLGLGDDMSWDIAALLLARGIPFAFATGHDLAGHLPAAFAAVPILRKPFRIADIEQPMRDLLARAGQPGGSRQ